MLLRFLENYEWAGLADQRGILQQRVPVWLKRVQAVMPDH